MWGMFAKVSNHPKKSISKFANIRLKIVQITIDYSFKFDVIESYSTIGVADLSTHPYCYHATGESWDILEWFLPVVS